MFEKLEVISCNTEQRSIIKIKSRWISCDIGKPSKGRVEMSVLGGCGVP